MVGLVGGGGALLIGDCARFAKGESERIPDNGELARGEGMLEPSGRLGAALCGMSGRIVGRGILLGESGSTVQV